jgi:pimeloyl-ACP methyl ester carboxylesterase
MAAGEAQAKGYAQLGELEMYYEIHGSGPPLLLAHGAYMSVDAMAPLTTRLAEHRQVVVMEQQAHARTADVDRPITYEQMADDTAALARHLGLGEADFVGYSMGAGIGLQLAIRHPDVVRRLVAASASYTSDGMHAAALEMFPSITPELFAGSPMETEYLRLAPNPGDFPQLVEKLKTLDSTPFAWPEEDLRGIAAPTMIIVGDSDVVRLEHAVELFGLLGGGVMGDLTGLPQSQLVVLPGTTHYVPPGAGVMDRVDWMLPMILPFLDPPAPAEA